MIFETPYMKIRRLNEEFLKDKSDDNFMNSVFQGFMNDFNRSCEKGIDKLIGYVMDEMNIGYPCAKEYVRIYFNLNYELKKEDERIFIVLSPEFKSPEELLMNNDYWDEECEREFWRNNYG